MLGCGFYQSDLQAVICKSCSDFVIGSFLQWPGEFDVLSANAPDRANVSLCCGWQGIGVATRDPASALWPLHMRTTSCTGEPNRFGTLRYGLEYESK
jgi:hypothetical protein